ncbi:MAG: folate-binding protein YgfZ [Flavobacteriaceae bacterium]
MPTDISILDDRAVVAVEGPDARHLLQSLLTVEIDGIAAPRHAALLTPQGKIMFEFVLYPSGDDGVLIDIHESLAAEFVKRLTFYRLRAKATIEDRSQALKVGWAKDGGGLDADPRLAALGGRGLVASSQAEGLASGAEAFRRHRMDLGVAEMVHDYDPSDIFPHDAGLDLLMGVDFDKGCFVGQEVVSRMKHRGGARKRFLPVTLDGPAEKGAEIAAGERGLAVMGGSEANEGLALFRLDRLEEALAAGQSLKAGETLVTPRRPDWWPERIAGLGPA